MKRNSFLIGILCLGSWIFGQIELEWEKNFGSSVADNAYGMDVNDQGFVFMGGSTRGYGATLTDYLVIKTDPNGNQIWEKTFAPAGQDDSIFYVLCTDDGGCLVTGYCRPGWTQIAVYKLDEFGNEEWHRLYGGASADYSTQILPALDGGYLISGTYWDGNAYDAQIIKIDENGNQLWRKVHIGGPGQEHVYRILPIASENRYLLLGRTNSTGLTNGGYDSLIFNLDINGDEISRHHYGGILDDEVWDAFVDEMGSIYLFGSSRNGPNGGWDAMITKLNPDLSEEWRQYYGGSGDEIIYDFEQLDSDNFLLCGSTTTQSSGGTDYYSVQTDSNGNQKNEGRFGGSQAEEAWRLVQKNGVLYASGYTNTDTLGDYDFSLLKLNINTIDLEKGLVVHYPLNGDATDASGNGNDGSPNGGVVFSEGVDGQAASFDGIDDYIDLGTTSLLSSGSEKTISAWVSVENSSRAMMVFSRYQDYNAYKGYNLNLHFGKPRIDARRSSGSPLFSYSGTGPDVSDGNWHHIVGTYSTNTNTIQIFVDGVLASSNPLNLVPQDFNEAYIGCSREANIGLRMFFEGKLDEIRVYNRALNEAEIQALYSLEPVVPKPSLEDIIARATFAAKVEIPESSTWNIQEILETHYSQNGWIQDDFLIVDNVPFSNYQLSPSTRYDTQTIPADIYFQFIIGQDGDIWVLTDAPLPNGLMTLMGFASNIQVDAMSVPSSMPFTSQDLANLYNDGFGIYSEIHPRFFTLAQLGMTIYYEWCQSNLVQNPLTPIDIFKQSNVQIFNQTSGPIVIGHARNTADCLKRWMPRDLYDTWWPKGFDNGCGTAEWGFDMELVNPGDHWFTWTKAYGDNGTTQTVYWDGQVHAQHRNIGQDQTVTTSPTPLPSNISLRHDNVWSGNNNNFTFLAQAEDVTYSNRWEYPDVGEIPEPIKYILGPKQIDLLSPEDVPPVITGPTNLVISEDMNQIAEYVITDINQNIALVEILDLPDFASFDSSTGVLDLYPMIYDRGTFHFQIHAVDATNLETTLDIQLEVAPVVLSNPMVTEHFSIYYDESRMLNDLGYLIEKSFGQYVPRFVGITASHLEKSLDDYEIAGFLPVRTGMDVEIVEGGSEYDHFSNTLQINDISSISGGSSSLHAACAHELFHAIQDD